MLGQLERVVDQRLRLVLLHPPDVETGQLQRGFRLLVLASGRPCGVERPLLELLGLCETPDPSGDSCTTVGREETAFVVVGFDHLQRPVGELDRTRELTVERRGGLRQGGQGPRLKIARALGGSLLGDDGHLVADDWQVAEL